VGKGQSRSKLHERTEYEKREKMNEDKLKPALESTEHYNILRCASRTYMSQEIMVKVMMEP
jgi:hypothetical protein